MKIPIAVLLGFAKSEGYGGDPKDVKAMKAHLTDPNLKGGPVLTFDYEGHKDLSIADSEFEDNTVTNPPAKGRKLTAAAGTASTVDGNTVELPADFDDKVNARVKRLMTDAGFKFDGNKVVPINPASEVKAIKAPEEREYEDQIKFGRARFKSYGEAMVFAQWMAFKACSLTGDFHGAMAFAKKALDLGNKVYGADLTIKGKALVGDSATSAAAVVPDQLMPDLIKNVNEFGVWEKLTKVYRTNVPQLVVPRRTAGLTAYFQGQQGSTLTESNQTYDDVQLNAKDLYVYSTISRQLLQDAAISVADETMEEMALAIATKQDQCLLIGDGTGTYGGMIGFDKKFGGVATDAGGYLIVGGTTSDAHTHANLTSVIGRLPAYALRNAVWTCTPAIKAAVFDRLSTSTNVGGLMKTEVTETGPVFRYMGFPIVLNNVMNSTVDAGSVTYGAGFTAGDVPDVLFGDFSRASKGLLLRDVEMASSEHRNFDANKIAYRAIVRFHTVVHDVGTTTAAGPVVSLWQT